MKAILLAAGKGSRISKNIPPIPKSTLDVGGIPLILKTIRMLENHGIECAVVTGYKHKIIENVLKGTDTKIYYNPFYDVTNSIGSLYFARDFIEQDKDLLIGNADVFWTEDILDLLNRSEQKAVMLSDVNRVDDGDYFFGTENHIIKRYGKELTRDERDCEYVGIAKLDHSFVPIFKKRLIDMIDRQQHGVWWENVLYSLTKEYDIYSLDVDGRFWAEVDFIEDYQRILEHVRADSL